MNIKHEELDIKDKPFSKESVPEPINQQEYFCSHCQYSTQHKPNLKAHLRIHSPKKPFACQQCNYKTVDKSNLKAHEKVHSGEKPHRCQHCDYSTTSKYYLKQHECIHTGDHLFKCKLCDKSYRYRNAFTRHWRKHTGEEKVLKCNVCAFQTTCPSSIRNHTVSHSDNRPFACDHCPYRAKLKKLLKKHQKALRHDYPKVCFPDGDSEDTCKKSDVVLLDLEIVPNECIVFNSLGSISNFSSKDSTSNMNSSIKLETVSNDCLVFNASDFVIKEEAIDMIYDET